MLKYGLPEAEYHWTWISFDPQKSLRHLNEYLMEFYRESSYIKNFLTFSLKAGIGWMLFRIGGGIHVYLFLVYNNDEEKKDFHELFKMLNKKWENNHSIKEIDSLIQNSVLGKRWYGYLTLEPKKLEIFSHLNKYPYQEKDITTRVEDYFKLMRFKTIVHGDD